MKKIIIILLFAYISFSGFSQTSKLTWKPKFDNKPSGSLITSIIGLDEESNIYSLRRGKYNKTVYDRDDFSNKYYIDKHNSKGLLVYTKPLNIIVKDIQKTRLDGIYMIGGEIIGFASSLLKSNKKKFEVVYAFKITSEGEIDKSSYKEVARCNAAPLYGKLSSGFSYTLSEDKKKILLSSEYDYGYNSKVLGEKMLFTVVDQNLNVLWKKNIKQCKEYMHYESRNIKLDKDGNLLYSVAYKESSKKSYECLIIKYEFKEDIVKKEYIKLEEDKTPISVFLEEDKYTGKLIVHGFYVTSKNGLGCYSVNYEKDLTVNNYSFSKVIYTLNKPYDFDSYSTNLVTLGYYPIKGNGGYISANVRVIGPKNDKSITTLIVLKLDTKYNFEWLSPIKKGYVLNTQIFSTYAIPKIINNKLFYLLNSDREFFSIDIDEEGKQNATTLYSPNSKESMVVVTDTHYDISDKKIILHSRKLTGITGSSKESQFGYITIE